MTRRPPTSTLFPYTTLFRSMIVTSTMRISAYGDKGRRTRTSAGASGRKGAGRFFGGRADDFQALVRTRNRRRRREDVPAILDLIGGEGGDRVHFRHELVIARPEIALARFHDVELRAFLEVSDDRGAFCRSGLGDRLDDHPQGVVIAPGLVFGRLAVFSGERLDERLRAG